MSLHGATTRMTAREFQRLTRRDDRRDIQRRLGEELRGADGLLRAELCGERPCPLCAADERRRVFTAGGSEYLLCSACGLLHVGRYLLHAHRPAPPQGDDDYVPFYLSDTQRAFDEPKFRHGVELLRAHAPAPLEVLDVGTGAGLFLEVLAGEGVGHLGVDLSRASYGDWHAERGLAVTYGRFEDLELERGRFGAISFWDCLEHLIDPGATLDACSALLEPGGVVLVLVPNAGSLAARVMRERCAMFDGIEHVNMFSPATLDALFERHGYRRAHLETIIPEINVLNNYLDYDDPYAGASEELARVLGLDELDESFVLRHDLGYKILALYAVAG